VLPLDRIGPALLLRRGKQKALAERVMAK
jgi:hypothetical protein